MARSQQGPGKDNEQGKWIPLDPPAKLPSLWASHGPIPRFSSPLKERPCALNVLRGLGLWPEVSPPELGSFPRHPLLWPPDPRTAKLLRLQF